MATLNNIPIEVVIDTACSRSVIPQTFVNKHHIQTFQTDITCTFGNSSKASNCYITESLTVALHDNTNQLTFIVLPRKNVLLGLDWLYMTQAVINVFARTISFPLRTILLSQSDDINDEIYLTECDHDQTYQSFN